MTLTDFFDTYFIIVIVSIVFSSLVLSILPEAIYKPFQTVVLKIRKELEEMVTGAFKQETLEVTLLSKFLVPFLIFLILSNFTMQQVPRYEEHLGIVIMLYVTSFLLILNAVPRLQDLDDFLAPDQMSMAMFVIKLLVLVEFNYIAQYIPPFFIIVILIFPYSALFGEQTTKTSTLTTW